jgi:aryl-alcohol dehydrogenase-like predicted oxidoreductase
MRWVLQQPGITAPIMGARTVEQFESTLGCVGWELDASLLARLNEVSEMPVTTYPEGFLARGMRD